MTAKHKDDVIEINVGGKVFSCRRSTLRLEKHSLLSNMFAVDSPFGDLTRDHDGRPFIDRDGDIFASILKYLRNGGNIPRLHDLSLLDLAELREEAEYFSLKNLVDVIDGELKKREEVDERKRKEREDEEHEKKRQRICKKWGFDEENEVRTPGQECLSFTCGIEELASEINYITCGPNEYNGYKVHSIVPILHKGTTVKMHVLLIGTELVDAGHPTREEQRYLPEYAREPGVF